MLTANELRGYIMNGLPCDHLEVLGDDGQHFEAVVVSSHFTDKTKVQQHAALVWLLAPKLHIAVLE